MHGYSSAWIEARIIRVGYPCCAAWISMAVQGHFPECGIPNPPARMVVSPKTKSAESIFRKSPLPESVVPNKRFPAIEIKKKINKNAVGCTVRKCRIRFRPNFRIIKFSSFPFPFLITLNCKYKHG